MNMKLSREINTDMYVEFLKNALIGTLYKEHNWTAVNAQAEKIKPFMVKRLFRLFFIRQLEKRSLKLIKMSEGDDSTKSEGSHWPLVGYTMIGTNRMDNIRICVEKVLENNIDGDLVETGVWRGGATIFMRGLLKVYHVQDKNVWVVDSFEGLPPAEANDGGDLSMIDVLKVSLDEVKSNFDRFGLLDDQVKFLKGWFSETLPGAPINSISVLRLDGDLYSSTMDSLENLYHKISPGGFLILDDYYAWASCQRAVTDFREKNNIHNEIKKIDWSGAYWQVS